MKTKIIAILTVLIPAVALGIHPPKNLKVDYNVNPLGIDNEQPGFSWETGDLNRGAVQSA